MHDTSTMIQNGPDEDLFGTPLAPERKFGTREWAETSFNIGIGCKNNCRYCFARANALERRIIGDGRDWPCERLKAAEPQIKRWNGTVMFPTTHDITPFYLEASVAALKRLLAAGNRVLIVSKPHESCVTRLLSELQPHRANILFRFTIGTLNEALAGFWEPGAPKIGERVRCLIRARNAGFETSVSMEPMLAGADDALETFRALEPFVTEMLWLGKMNQVQKRVAPTTPEIREACFRIQRQQCDSEILRLVRSLKHHPKVAWKDSIRRVVESGQHGQ